MAGSARGQGYGRPSRSPDFAVFNQPAAAGDALPAKARQTPEIRLSAGRRPSPRHALAKADDGVMRVRHPQGERTFKGPCPRGFHDVQTSQPPCQGRSLQKFETGRKSPMPCCRFDLSDTSGPVNRAGKVFCPFLIGITSQGSKKLCPPGPPLRSGRKRLPTPPRRSLRSSSTGHRALATLTYGENDHGKRTGIHHGNRHGL